MATPVEVTTDANGAFDFECDAGSYTVEASLAGYKNSSLIPATVVDGATTDIGTITLAKQKGRIKGSVKDSKGIAIPGVKVVATPK